MLRGHQWFVYAARKISRMLPVPESLAATPALLHRRRIRSFFFAVVMFSVFGLFPTCGRLQRYEFFGFAAVDIAVILGCALIRHAKTVELLLVDRVQDF